MTSNKRPTLENLIHTRLSRRSFLQKAGVATAVLASQAFIPKFLAPAHAARTIGFTAIQAAYEENLSVAAGFKVQLLRSWGDALHDNILPFNPLALTAKEQELRFGYNNDFCAYMPLPFGSGNSTHGLLCINHEYPNTPLMFPGLGVTTAKQALTKEQAEIEMAALGHSVMEISKEGGTWQVVTAGPYNRRITAFSTPCRITGPAAGHSRLKTTADHTGTKVIGTFANCSGGKTPWGTILSGEENVDDFFEGKIEGTSEERNHKRMGISPDGSRYAWARHFPRFDVTQEPNEPNRFGWIVEIDPYDPQSMPVKRTALGRFKHEAATCVLAPSNHVVVYMGDDEQFEYLYKFITRKPFDAKNLKNNRNLLDEGTLYTAQFHEDGTVKWLSLVYGAEPLTKANGFNSQADVLIETRRAAELVGATPMDRPEDVETNPVSGKTYVSLTNNIKRLTSGVANPTVPNLLGHVIELIPPTKDGVADHSALECKWDIFIQGNEALSCPDNLAFSPDGTIWVATDGMPETTGKADGVFAMEVKDSGEIISHRFINAPRGAEVCGPEFTPDGSTLFLCIQHPGEDSTFDNPSTRWPDFNDTMPPRPSVIAITKE